MNILFIFFASQTPQGLPQETNDATNSSAPGKKFAFYLGGDLCIRKL